MANTDDQKNARATLKLAEAYRLILGAVVSSLVPDQSTEDALAEADRLVASAEQDARGVDNGALRDYEITP